jgi:hypothetical protein
MSEFQLCMAALRRPLNYSQQSGSSQWATDKSLGILDWDGINLEKAQACIDAGDESDAHRRFKMSVSELRQVVDGFNQRLATQGAPAAT